MTGLNRDKLKRGFKLLFGVPPHCFNREIRMQEAKRLLQQTEKPVSEIAYLVGYGQPNNFCTAFTKHAGCTPLQFRLQEQ